MGIIVSGRSSGMCMPEKKGCSSASAADIRLLKSNKSIWRNRSIAYSSAVGNTFWKSLASQCGIFLIQSWYSQSAMVYFTSSSDGVPINLKMRCNWSAQCFPCSNQLPVSSSANIKPIDQMSTAVVYWWFWRRSSGARYQRVTTYSVRSFAFCFQSTFRARPKSHILISSFQLTSIF